jgi:capsular exopolysaccharide synthesis family protein
MSDQAKNTSIPLLSNYTPHSRFAEAYRSLRTNIQFAAIDKQFKSLLVTSAGPGEGKTSTVANLAHTMAQTNKSVLMLDADMRRPSLSKNYTLNEKSGITGLLSGLFGDIPLDGQLADITLGDLFRLLGFLKKTGILNLSSADQEVELFFLKGELADLNWKTRPPEKKLATVLVKDNLLSQEHADLVINRQKDTGQRIGYIIFNMGLIKKEILSGALNIHIIEALQVALQLNSGSFRFRELYESDIDVSTDKLVDLPQLFRQTVAGREKLTYIEAGIRDAVEAVGDNLYLLPTGPIPPNPSEILGSARMAFLLEHLQNMYDVIIIDSPPLLPASDALLIAPLVHGVVLVVKAGYMNREMVAKAVSQLNMTGTKILGVVLNDVNIKKEGYSNYYRKYYGEYYGEQSSKT